MKLTVKPLLVPLLYLLILSSFFYYLEAIQSLLMILMSLLLLSIVKFRDFKCTYKNAPFIGSFAIATFYYLFYFNSPSLKLIGESFLLFIAPLFSYYLYETDAFIKNKQRIQFAYCVSISLLCLYFLGFYAIDIPNHHFDWYLARYNLEMHSKIHGTYMCLWIGIALLFLVDYSLGYKKYSSLLKFALICMFASLLSGLIIYNSRNIILGLVLVSFLLILIVKKQKNVIPFSIKIAIGCSIILVILFSQRYIDAFRFFSTDSYTNSTRYASWSCSWKLICESHFLGMDYSLIQEKLNQCYEPIDNFELKKFKINSHNQYLDFLLKGGLGLFIAFFSSLFIKIKETLQQQQYLYFSITVLFVISFITENILVRQYGIYIYFVCDLLFLGSIFRHKNHSIHKIEKN